MVTYSMGNWDYVWGQDSIAARKIRKMSPSQYVNKVPKREWVLLDNKNNYLATSLTGFFWRYRVKQPYWSEGSYSYWRTLKFNYGSNRT